MNKMKLFAIWLDGYITDKDSIDKKSTETIKTKLNGLFEHEAEELDKPTLEELGKDYNFEVTPGFPGENNHLNLGEDENGVKYRC